MNHIIVFILTWIFIQQTNAQQRKAWIGVIGTYKNTQYTVDSIVAGSTCSYLGLQKNDALLSINGNTISSSDNFFGITGKLFGNEKISVDLIRNNERITLEGKTISKPFETSNTEDILYDFVPFKNGFLRTVIRKPKDETNLPCILFIPGYNCGSIENFSKGYNGKLIDEWVKNGYAVVTIEKSGVGDSYDCVPCNEVDLETDIESFDAGYVFMEQLPFVNKNKLFIWGHSMGGTIAPEIAKKHTPKGVMVFACVYRPWSEFLLEMHRVQKPLLDNLSYAQTDSFLRVIQKIYYEFFVEKKSPEELYKNPAYKELVASELEYKEGSTNQWGRHWRFWQQIDSLNLAKSWSEINCPVLVLHGGADYIQCSAVEPYLITETVNKVHPHTATQITIPDIDHLMMNSKNYEEAVQHFNNKEYSKGNFNYKIAVETVKWLEAVLHQKKV